MSDQTAIQKVRDYMHSDMIRARFAEVVGSQTAGAYISSVLLEVANREDLQRCTMQSIYMSALRAATLHLSVDSNLGQAYLVPFKNVCTLIVGYKGLVDLATRTGRYRFINVGKIYEGEEVIEDRITGFHSIQGGKKSDKVIGWIASFQMMNGFGKTLYMSLEEIHAHAKQYSANYNYNGSTWKKDPQAMERKTPLRLLMRKWGYLDPNDAAVLSELESENGNVIEGEVVQSETDKQEKPKKPRKEAEILADLGVTSDVSVTKVGEPAGEVEVKIVSEETQESSTPHGQLLQLLIETLVSEKLAENEFAAKEIIKKMELDLYDRDTALKMARGYRGWRDLSASYDQAAKFILKGDYPK